jgi:hypothetical protein
MSSHLSYLAAEAHREDLLRAAMSARLNGKSPNRRHFVSLSCMLTTARLVGRRSRVFPAMADVASDAGSKSFVH